MYLKNIKIQNFRNFRDASFDFPDGLIVIEGKNGIGKTNLLEAIYLLCTGKSQRKSNRSEMIKFGCNHFFVEGDFLSKIYSLNVGFGYTSDKKISLLLNQHPKEHFTDWFGKRPIISFNSDDLFLISGSPENRRKFIDLFGCYSDSLYLQDLMTYRYIIQRKNILLRSKKFNEIQCEVYDEKLAETGSQILLKRSDLISQINRFFSDVYCDIAQNSDCVKIEYDSVLETGKYSKDTCKNVFYSKLLSFRQKDLDAGFSTFGPHREDLKISINGKNSRKFASQGQCRTLALSLKLSSSFSLEEKLHERSIFIIDDTVSELDSYRLDNFFSIVNNRGQVFIAAPVGRISNQKDFLKVDIPEDFY